LRGQGTGLYLRDDRTDSRYAMDIQRGVGQPSEQEIGTDAGEQHRNAMGIGRGVNARGRSASSTGACAFIGEAHVATERNRGEHVLRAIATNSASAVGDQNRWRSAEL
jgi:hypothetical protein